MRVLLSQGEEVIVQLADADGEVVINYNADGDDKFTITTDMPDTFGRAGVIYEEDFGVSDDDPGKATAVVE